VAAQSRAVRNVVAAASLPPTIGALSTRMRNRRKIVSNRHNVAGFKNRNGG
jgi:hypothetical protein